MDAVSLSGRKEVKTLLLYIIRFAYSVLAGLVANYICKWLDRDK